LGGPLQNKMMKKTFLISMMLCFLVTACNGQRNIATVFPSSTPTLRSTATSTIVTTSTKVSTPTRIQPTQPPSTPTFTPFPPFHGKRIVFDYYVIGNQADFDMFFDPPSGNILTRLVLYDDGQMIIADGDDETYKQKVLSSTEIKSFLSKLEVLGFYSLESNQNHDPTDKLYNFEGKYEEVGVIGGLKYCILVNADKSRNLCVKDSYIQYLIPKMMNILKYLDKFKPVGMTSYFPDRILLTVREADPSSDTLPATVTPWNENFPSLEFTHPSKYAYDDSSSTMYVDGDMAKEIYLFFENSDGNGVFTQNGKDHIVSIRVLLPHEKVINAYQ
jgi:hypothetical protein